jgi:hypothetical protein
MCAMGSCIKVVKQKKIGFLLKKKMLSLVTVKKQNGKFSVIICKTRLKILSVTNPRAMNLTDFI